jgi:hypothetical protein
VVQDVSGVGQGTGKREGGSNRGVVVTDGGTTCGTGFTGTMHGKCDGGVLGGGARVTPKRFRQVMSKGIKSTEPEMASDWMFFRPV